MRLLNSLIFYRAYVTCVLDTCVLCVYMDILLFCFFAAFFRCCSHVHEKNVFEAIVFTRATHIQHISQFHSANEQFYLANKSINLLHCTAPHIVQFSRSVFRAYVKQSHVRNPVRSIKLCHTTQHSRAFDKFGCTKQAYTLSVSAGE